MVQVCQRSVTKQAMLNESLQQYKEIFRVVKDNWGTVVQVNFFSLVLRQYAHSDARLSDNTWMVTEMMMSAPVIPVGPGMEVTDEERTVELVNGEGIVVLLKEVEMPIVKVQGGG